LVEAGAHCPHAAGIGEGFRLIDKLLALRRVEPGLEVRFGIEAQDGQTIVLNAGHRRLDPVALKAWRLRLCRGDSASPFAVGVFLPRFDPRRDHGGDRRRQRAGLCIDDEMDIVLSDQNRLRFGNQALALAGPEPCCRRIARGEALQDDPVDLRRRGGWHDRFLDEAGLLRH